jgi:hypothetical protein
MSEQDVSRETSPVRAAVLAALQTDGGGVVGTTMAWERLVDAIVTSVEAVPVVPAIEGNGSMDGVTPILYFEAGSRVMHELRAALTWANVNHVRITIDDGHLKWKISEGAWTPGYPSEQPDGGNG